MLANETSTTSRSIASARYLLATHRAKGRFNPLDAKDPKFPDPVPEQKPVITIEDMLDVHPRIFYKWLDAQEIQH
jgi:hypothetical protein